MVNEKPIHENSLYRAFQSVDEIEGKGDGLKNAGKIKNKKDQKKKGISNGQKRGDRKKNSTNEWNRVIRIVYEIRILLREEMASKIAKQSFFLKWCIEQNKRNAEDVSENAYKNKLRIQIQCYRRRERILFKMSKKKKTTC